MEQSLDSFAVDFRGDVAANDQQVEAPTDQLQLVIIDAAVTDADDLITDLESQLAAGESLRVEFLDGETDGVEQITRLLAQDSGIDAVHIVSHGADGAIKLGSTWLHTANVDGYAGEIARWAGSLAANADILIYGCDLAASDHGTTLVDELSALTGADVAASVDVTGSGDLGGDWELEYATGEIDTAVVFSPEVQQAWSGRLATLVVTNTADSGAGSLRDAIDVSNASVGTHDTIEFMIGSGIQTINLSSGLTITDSVTIDGWTQPGWVDNPMIHLDGSGAGINADGFDISAGNTTIRGLAINGFDAAGIWMHASGNNLIEANFIGTDVAGTATAANNADGISVESDDNVIVRNIISGNAANGIILLNANANVVQGNYIGTDATGMLALGNVGDGIRLVNAHNNIIGGSAPAERNVVSGNVDPGVADAHGIEILFGSTGNRVEGNYIGLAMDGDTPLGNEADGIHIDLSNNNWIGAPGAGNVFSANGDGGIAVINASGNVIQSNLIGTDATGTVARGNVQNGIVLRFGAANNIIGGTDPGEGNTIAHNGSSGVTIISDWDLETGNAIRGNSIFANTILGIDLDDDGVTANDLDDFDTGGNRLKNFPVISAVQVNGTNVTISGKLNSANNTTYELDFFANPSVEPSGHGQGQTYLDTSPVTTDTTGNTTFNIVLPVGVLPGTVISATTTDPFGNTSEFSFGVAAATSTTASQLFLSTDADVGASSIPELGSWTAGEVLRFAPTSLFPSPTTGTFSSLVNLDGFNFTEDSDVEIDAIHYVSRDLFLGGAVGVAVKEGDLLLSITGSEELTGSDSVTRTVDNNDVIIFRPDSPGSYTSGVFLPLFGGATADIRGLTLIEQNTTVGDITLDQGDFLFSRSGGSQDNDIWVYHIEDHSFETLIEGDEIGIDEKIMGLELVEDDTDIAGSIVPAGSILLTVDSLDDFVGSTSITVNPYDIFYLEVNQTTLVAGTGNASAEAGLLFDGLAVGLDTGEEDISALTLVEVSTTGVTNNSPVAVADSYSIDEDTTLDSNVTWFDSNWLFRRKLVFDNLSQTQDLADFPVLVTLDASRIDYAQTDNAGHDLRFVDRDGTVLAHEIEEWNEAGTSYVWVKAPQIDGNSNTDFIWMYYGNPSAPNGEDATNVWRTDYKAVWHLDETASTHFDSTANNQDLNQSVGGVNKSASGKVDGADEFDGLNDYLSRTGADVPLQITGDLTLEAWIWMDSYPGDSTFDMGTDAAVIEFAGFGDGDSAENYLYSLIVQNNGDIALGHESGTGTNHFQDMGVSLTLNEWHQLTAVRDAAAMEWKLFLDGAPREAHSLTQRTQMMVATADSSSAGITPISMASSTKFASKTLSEAPIG